MAEKRILETELTNLKEKTPLQPRELFPQNQGSALVRDFSTSPPEAKSFAGEDWFETASGSTATSSGLVSPLTFALSNSAAFGNFTANNSENFIATGSSTVLPIQNQSSVPISGSNHPTYLDKRQKEMKDQEILASKKRSVEELLREKTRQLEDYKETGSRRQKICSVCHCPGHNKNKCKNGPCTEIANCRYDDKHPELKSEIQELKRILKDLEKKEDKSKNDYDVFKAARDRASSSFFAIMCP